MRSVVVVLPYMKNVLAMYVAKIAKNKEKKQKRPKLGPIKKDDIYGINVCYYSNVASMSEVCGIRLWGICVGCCISRFEVQWDEH